MNTTKHTPGPWQFDGMWSLIMAGKYEIAAVHAARTHDETRKRKRIDETVANAQLISAAPDLLEACKAMLDLSDKCLYDIKQLGHIQKSTGEAYRQCRVNCLNAIQKAGAS